MTGKPGRKVMVLGAGGHAKVVIATLRAAGWEVAGVLDDDGNKRGRELLGVPVLGPLSEHLPSSGIPAVIAIGDNRTRRFVAQRYRGVEWCAVVHPAAHVEPSVSLGAGTVVFAGAVVQPDTGLGEHAIVNTGATIDHDCSIGDFAHIAPGVHLSGGVRIGEGALLGIGCSVKPGTSVGAWATVGAGAAVVADLPEGVIAVGVPAKAQHWG